MVTAPKGVAAFNIEGVTINHALNLPVQHGKIQTLEGRKVGSDEKNCGETLKQLSLMRSVWFHTKHSFIFIGD